MLHFSISVLGHSILYNKELLKNHICNTDNENDLIFYIRVYRNGGCYGECEFNCSREFKEY